MSLISMSEKNSMGKTLNRPYPTRLLAVGLVAVLTLFTLSPSPAQAASITTDVDIILPSILILFCYDDITVTITQANLVTLTGAASADDDIGTAGGTVTPGVVASTLEGTVITLDTALPSAVDPTAILLNMLDVCGVRAIISGAATGVDVSFALTGNTTLTGSVAGSMTVNSGGVRNGSGAGAFADFTFPAASLGLGTVATIDVQLNLDLSSATTAGTYSSAAAGTFTVTAVII